jgi:hypothetical protein
MECWSDGVLELWDNNLIRDTNKTSLHQDQEVRGGRICSRRAEPFVARPGATPKLQLNVREAQSEGSRNTRASNDC